MVSEVIKIDAILLEIAQADTPEKVIDIESKIEAAEGYMRKSGLYALDQIRPLNEARMRARWKLGRLLAEQERAKAPGKGKMVVRGFQSFLKKVGLTSPTATVAQRIGALPAEELEKALAESRQRDVLNTFDELMRIARPHWAKIVRKLKHKKIAEKAEAKKQVIIATDKEGVSRFAEELGPFPLIYADPPWRWDHFAQEGNVSENGKGRTPDQHYPTLTDEQIIGYLVQGKTIPEIAHEKAALFMWCTSSNVKRALRVFECWGFEFKTSAVWVKDKPGMGLVFRNQHEILLYGTRGAMPGPQWQPLSVFAYPRGEHSAKPPEVRGFIERMYPDFDENTRLELFARASPPGWSVWGLEAESVPSAAIPVLDKPLQGNGRHKGAGL